MLGVKLNHGISRINLISYFLIQFVCYSCLQLLLSYVSFILQDPDYYHIDPKDIGTVTGNLAYKGEIFVILTSLLAGPILDTLGRKIPLIIGYLIAGTSILLIPLFKSIYPSFLILRTLISMGTVIGMNVPLLPDYVRKESLGLANGYNEVVVSFAFIFASTGFYSINDYVSDQKYVYFGMGAFVIAISIFLIYGIKDVKWVNNAAKTENLVE